MKFEGTQVNIPIKGIMRAGTDNLCDDGAMNEVIGMEYKDGSWLPYKTTKSGLSVLYIGNNGAASPTTINLKKTYVHKTYDGQEHYVFISTDNELYYEKNRVEQESSEIIYTNKLISNTKDVEFVGNMLNLATDSGLRHYIWKPNEKEYEAVEETSFPDVNIRAELGFMSGDNKIIGVLYQNIQGDRSGRVRDVFEPVASGDLTKTDKEVVISSLMAAQGKVREKGGITGYCFAVVAFRLKNGDVVCPNAPILLGRPNAAHGSTVDGYREFCTETMSEYFPRSSGDPIKLYSLYEQGHARPASLTLNGALVDASKHFIYIRDTSALGFKTDETAGESTIELKHIVAVDPETGDATGEIMTYPRVYANVIDTVSVHSRAMVPDLNLTRVILDVPHGTQIVQICDYSYAAGNGVSVKIGELTDEQKEYISSVCVFLTQDVSIFKEYTDADLFADNFYQQSGSLGNLNPGTYDHRVFKYVPARKSEKKVIEELKRLNSFYLAKEIQIGDVQDYSDWKTLDLSGFLGDNLTVLEQLPVTSFVQTETIPEYIDAYNMRLHQYNYKQKLFEGYDLSKYAHNGGLGQYGEITEQAAQDDNQNTLGIITNTRTYLWEIKVSLKDRLNGRSDVVNYSRSELATIANSLSPLIVYPDETAESITISVYVYDTRSSVNGQNYNEKHSITLPLSHDWISGLSYYIDPELKPIIPPALYDEDALVPPPAKNSVPTFEESNIVRNYANGIKVSDVIYPSYFPAAYTYRIGNEKIIKLAYFTMPASQDQHGGYAIVIFCTDGIYTMDVDTSGNGVYTNTRYYSQEVCVNRNSICEIVGAIVFASDKGLMMVTPNGVEEFAPHLNGKIHFKPSSTGTAIKDGQHIYNKIVTHNNIVQLSDALSTDDFINYLHDSNTVVSYVSKKNKIVVYNQNKPYIYLIDIATRNTTKLNLSIAFDDDNSPEEIYFEKNSSQNYMHRFAYNSESGQIPCLIQSRPIKVQQDDKCSYRVVLTGYLEGAANTDKWAGLVVFGSDDCDNWHAIGVNNKRLNAGLHNFGCVTDRVSWKYMMFIFAGELSEKSHIDSIDITVGGRYNNKKR